MNLFNVTYDNNTISFAKGAKITLTDDFAKAIKEFYQEEPKRLKEELDKLEEAFIEKKQYLNTIDSLKEKIDKATDNKEIQRLRSRLSQVQEELKYCEESNHRIQDIKTSLEELKKVDVTKPIDVVFGIRPEDIYQKGRVLTDEAISQEFNLTVSVAELLGHEYFVHSDFEGGELVSKIHAKTIVSSGDQLQLVFDISKMHIFDSITQKRIK
ncbi:MAG: TOBE domain-containing protein [Bacillales bacterium]|nr:TOBE domain-containing protein [Bacillales bacterium]